MSTRESLVVWLASVVTVGAMGAGWIHTHPAPRIAKVNLGSLYEDQKKVLVAKLKPGMTDAEQQAVFQSATDYGRRVDDVLVGAAQDCRCAILNSAAIVQLPAGSDAGIPDLTERVRAALAGR